MKPAFALGKTLLVLCGIAVFVVFSGNADAQSASAATADDNCPLATPSTVSWLFTRPSPAMAARRRT